MIRRRWGVELYLTCSRTFWFRRSARRYAEGFYPIGRVVRIDWP